MAVSTLNAQNIFDLFKSKALRITTHAISWRQDWPFVTLPIFDAEADLLINQTSAGRYVALQPLANESQRSEWETYSQDLTWLQDSFDFRGIKGNPSDLVSPYISMVMGACIAEVGKPDPYYAPIWEVAPVLGQNEALINFNGFNSTFFSRTFEIMYKFNISVLSEVLNLEVNIDPGFGTVAVDSLPESMLVTPIFESPHEASSPIGAVLTAVIPWKDQFTDVLPEGEGEIVVVVLNRRSQAFTFKVVGPHVHYLGPEDLHNHAYDYLEIVDDFAAYVEDIQGHFGYTVHIYPTNTFVQENTTNHPIVYTIIVVFVFAFTASAFVLYDVLVERRQKKVLDTATKSSAIINSLFPSNVRQRLMEEAANTKAAKTDKTNAFSAQGIGSAFGGTQTCGTSKPSLTSSRKSPSW